MITPRPDTRQQAPQWQHALREAFTRPADLLDYLQIDPALPALALDRLRDFPLRVPRGFAARMRKGDPADPLFLQVWPRPQESEQVAGFGLDAVGDLHKTRDGGVIHKYQGRALLITTGACAVHCRYCFRRHFPYSDQLAAREQWREALQTLAGDPSIEEVILSGGDPLSLSDDKLASLSEALEQIPHLRRLRIHTRQPIVLPERVDERLLQWLGRGRLQKVIVLHVNHPQELDASVERALRPLRELQIPLLNQAVLLRGINDSAQTLRNLSEKLFACGILPYYLHMVDRVQGAAHFEVDVEAARRLASELVALVPGYLMPRLAREDAGAASKTWIAW
ncbi:EF-P beta-lysylation protein EpmB [Solimonas sp. K1W22B-7]|uniref:EF-P beta-lysylation protein EpmB n=1 Tax=Solimonas sp. K1W22B-7 TaxID=2303331 RepID=UPI000E333C70|nr:EF-P beta-lysylation protein EpmB [Solimonas sp. K1W22B-7]AXQ29084.1 EF-P beta-lysylation protein EpmB [Solimonas sp. K1W22B-7]